MVPTKWHEHVEAWLDQGESCNFTLVRYEDLLQDGSAELGRIADALDIAVEEEWINHVCEGASFEKMKGKEQEMGWDNDEWPEDESFIRRGESQAYKDEVPPSILEKFVQESGATLKKVGYRV